VLAIGLGAGCQAIQDPDARSLQVEIREMCSLARVVRDRADVLLIEVAAEGVSDGVLNDAEELVTAMEGFVASCRTYPVGWFLRQEIPA
jgi:hypothetical protein